MEVAFNDESALGAETDKQKKMLEHIVFGGQQGCKSSPPIPVTKTIPHPQDDSDADDATATDGETSDDDEAPDELPIAAVDPGSRPAEFQISELAAVNKGGKRDAAGRGKSAAAAWVDEDDHQFVTIPRPMRLSAKLKRSDDSQDNAVSGREYQTRLVDQFRNTVGGSGKTDGHGGLSWATLAKTEKRSKRVAFSDSDDDESDSDSDREVAGDIRQKAGRLVGTSKSLPKGQLNCIALRDITFGHRKRGKPMHSVEFHKSAQIALTAGEDLRLMLYQIDGKENPLLHSVAFDRFPISCAHFTADGCHILVGSRLHPHFHRMDMIESKVTKIPVPKVMGNVRAGRFVISNSGDQVALLGRGGQIHILSAKSMEWIETLQMNGEVEDFKFGTLSDKTGYSCGEEGEVYVWDMRARRCVHRFADEGCVRGSALALSANDRVLACGSNSGIMNLYDVTSALATKRPTPTTTVANLVTSITNIAFNPTGEMVSFNSYLKDDASKFLHLGSGTVFQDFPPRNMHRVQMVDFSVNGGYMALANDQGSVKLFRMNHYGAY